MKTNSLKFKTYKVAPNGEQWEINIRLNDECKNGHQDFSITGTSWEKGKPKTDRYMLHGGACGDEIATLWPEYSIFNTLHLCDYKGIPMHCSVNGYYHLKNGFYSKSEGDAFMAEYCEYYRLSKDEFMFLNDAESETHFAILLERLGVFAKWEKQANEAIKLLETLTGDEFIIDSKKNQYYRPEQVKIDEELQKIESGFYSVEKKAEREKQQQDARFLKLDEEEKTAIEKIKKEYEVKRLLLSHSQKLFDNAIFYNHSNEVCLNWRQYGDQLSDGEIETIKETIILPDGLKFTVKK